MEESTMDESSHPKQSENSYSFFSVGAGVAMAGLAVATTYFKYLK